MKTLLIEVPDTMVIKDCGTCIFGACVHSIVCPLSLANAKEAVEVDSESELSHTEVDGEPVTLFAIKKDNDK